MNMEKILDQILIDDSKIGEIHSLSKLCERCENVRKLTSIEICRTCVNRKRLIELCKKHKIDVVIEE